MLSEHDQALDKNMQIFVQLFLSFFLDSIIKKNPLGIHKSGQSAGQIFWLPATLIDILGTRRTRAPEENGNKAPWVGTSVWV